MRRDAGAGDFIKGSVKLLNEFSVLCSAAQRAEASPDQNQGGKERAFWLSLFPADNSFLTLKKQSTKTNKNKKSTGIHLKNCENVCVSLKNAENS